MEKTMNRNRRSSNRELRRGFSLLEVIIAVTIVALLATILLPNLNRFLRSAKADKARAEVNSLANQVRLYIATETTGDLSDDFTLDMLLEGDDPYLNNANELVDPWESPYLIIIPGDRNRDFDVMSFGPDGQSGGNDDIVNGKE